MITMSIECCVGAMVSMLIVGIILGVLGVLAGEGEDKNGKS